MEIGHMSNAVQRRSFGVCHAGNARLTIARIYFERHRPAVNFSNNTVFRKFDQIAPDGLLRHLKPLGQADTDTRP